MAEIRMEVKFDCRYRIVMSPQKLASLTGIDVDRLLTPHGIDDATMDDIGAAILEYVNDEFGYPGSGITELWNASEMTVYEVES